MRLAAIACAGALACSAGAQEILILEQRTDPSVEDYFGRACLELALPCEQTRSLDTFMTRLGAQEWDLVIVEQYDPVPEPQKAPLLALLEQHMDGRGALLINYTRLDEWPELQAFASVRVIADRFVPGRIEPTDPAHPSWGLRVGISATLFDWWSDNGDDIATVGESALIGTFRDTGGGCMALASASNLIVNGFDFPSLDGDQSGLIKSQVTFLLSCQPDLDEDGSLTLFDFLTFQNLFAAGDLRANFRWDTALDLFDFLAFQNAFERGCRRYP